MVRIDWTDQAKSDLRDIFDYISKDPKKYAKHQVIRIQLKTKILKQTPQIGRVVPELGDRLVLLRPKTCHFTLRSNKNVYLRGVYTAYFAIFVAK